MPTIEIVKCNPGRGYNVNVDGRFSQHANTKDQANGIKWIIEQAVAVALGFPNSEVMGAA